MPQRERHCYFYIQVLVQILQHFVRKSNCGCIAQWLENYSSQQNIALGLAHLYQGRADQQSAPCFVDQRHHVEDRLAQAIEFPFQLALQR